jgi:hypothetical protein
VERHSAGIFGMGEETVVREIYRNKNVEAVNGKDADKIYRNTKENSKKNDKNTAKLTESYGCWIQDFTNKIVELKNSVFECYIKGIELEASMISEERKAVKDQLSSIESVMGERSISEMPTGEESELSQVGALLEKFEISESKDFLCESGNNITRICINEKC